MLRPIKNLSVSEEKNRFFVSKLNLFGNLNDNIDRPATQNFSNEESEPQKKEESE